MMEAFRPTHVVVLTPMPRILRWARRSGSRVLSVFADSFSAGPLHRLWRFGRLHAQLNDRRVEWVANHGRNACRSLVRIGVKAAKVLPCDFLQVRRPHDRPAKSGPGERRSTLFFAGEVIALKGVGDLVEAIADLKRRGLDVGLQIAGKGAADTFRDLADRLGVADRVEFLGTVPNANVPDRMRAAAAMVVPSRHRYPEGLPLTIYEALCSRTPLIASDHPMFLGNLTHGETALIFPAGQPAALADRVAALFADPALYRRLSDAAQRAWEGLQIPVKWGDLMLRWSRGTDEDIAWIRSNTITYMEDAA
ncbi:Glycosyltransferase involved in cell wall bisynthesis [Sphingomonas gellani]|uniref:Glycosyltransferase involved in cell wall bisynthesis n=1 Tax=Sphingomonas gellani TaxID=1166340 RepID=A0A1H8B2U4_9SPHN|nr:glycosyltransferase family 4 protein [Sphingomonas gellani]SEM77083.1 Glycosyltransferase involved in cell wall bisynthesis [Sphingomonas gellani]